MLTNENLNNKNQVKAFTSDIMQTATTASMVTPYIGINRDKKVSCACQSQIVGGNYRWNGSLI